MSAPLSETKPARRPLARALVAFLLLSALMYVSIMWKIIHYGP